jgi:glycosyltransferase involved in cell wall biosynthesis
VTGEAATHRAAVPPVADGSPRPLWSVVIPTFNCSRYLRATLASVLEQDPGPGQMQIEVIDDHSSDDPEAVVAEVGGGRVKFFRQARNVGHTRNFHTGLMRSRGHLIHLLHGDDCVLPGFYARLQAAFATHPEIGAAFCRHQFIDADGGLLGVSDQEQPRSGVLENCLERLALEMRIMTPSIAVRRLAYEQLGAFDARLVCAEDWEMWMRVAAHFPIWYEIEPLAAYRMHPDSNTGRHTRSGDDMRYTGKAIDMFEPYLPRDRARYITNRARTTYALAAIRQAHALREQGDWRGARAQLGAALSLSRSARVLRALIGFAAHSAWPAAGRARVPR